MQLLTEKLFESKKVNKNRPYYQKLREKIGKSTLLLPAVAVFIKNKKGEMLLVRKRGSKLWVFPGGYMEMGESVEQTAKREVLEETGFVVKPNKKIIGICSGKKFNKKYPNGDSVQPLIIFIAASIVKQKERTDKKEISQLKFFSMQNPPRMEKCCKIKYQMLFE